MNRPIRRRRRTPNLRSRRPRNSRRNRRMRGTFVSLHSRRPIPQQVDPRPLNFGAGGTSTTIRFTRQVNVSIPISSTSSELSTFSSCDDITLTEMFQDHASLAKWYEQVLIRSARATFTPFFGSNAKTQIAFSFLPDTLVNYCVNPAPTNFQNYLDSGLFVLKRANKVSSASWLPNTVEDYTFRDFDTDGHNSYAPFKHMIFGILDPTDLGTPIVVSSTMKEYLIGYVTYDVNVTLRGRNKASMVERVSEMKSIVVSPFAKTTSNVVSTGINEAHSSVSTVDESIETNEVPKRL